MNKTHKIITSFVVMALLSLSLPLMMTRATSETGFDYINEGDRYEFKRIIESSGTYISENNDLVSEESSRTEKHWELVIEGISKDKGIANFSSSLDGRSSEDNKTTPHTSLRINEERIGGQWVDLEFDHGMYVAVDEWADPYFLLRTWNNYSGEFDDFEEQLENATDDYDEFKSYSFNIDDDAQTIELEMEYIEADMDTAWNESTEVVGTGTTTEIYNISVTHNVKEEITISYDNFILDEYKEVTTKTVNDVKNSSYLEDNDIVYLQELYSDDRTYYFEEKPQMTEPDPTFLEQYGLWLWIGMGIAGGAVIGAVIWKKRKTVFGTEIKRNGNTSDDDIKKGKTSLKTKPEENKNLTSSSSTNSAKLDEIKENSSSKTKPDENGKS
ncbi:MAG: hypothetical protein R6U96_06540 [Promethearchaeia archaeon]